MKKIYTFIFAALICSTSFAQVCDSLFSSCVSTFSRNGYFFDIEATGGTVLIEHISTMSQNCGSRDVSIYYRTNSYLGNESSSTGWTLAGTLSNVTPICSTSCPIPVTPLNIPINVSIPMGQRYGFYVTMTAGTGTFESHNNFTEGSIGAQDAMITLYTGKGQANIGAFTGSLTASLTFQGTIQYSCATSVFEASTQEVSLFPNPVNATLYFSLPLKNVSVYNSFGQLVFFSESEINEIGLEKFSAGIYFISSPGLRTKFLKQY